MARRGPLSPAQKAAISAGLKRYHAARRANSSGTTRTTLNIDTGKQISREEVARRMFGSVGAAKKIAAGKRRKGSNR